MTTTRVCNTPGCGRSTPSVEHAFCRECIGTVLRTSRPPEIQRPAVSPWVQRALAGQLPVKAA